MAAALRCPGCHAGWNAPDATMLGRRGPYVLHVCPDCRLTFCDPMRAGDPAFYAAHTEYDEKWEFEVVARLATQRGLKGSLLDVGCGDGRFLERVTGVFDGTGLDFSPRAVEASRVGRGLPDVHATTLEDFAREHPLRSYDLVTAFHILEHVEDPDSFVAVLAGRLKPQGLLALSFPNPDRWALRWTREIWDYPPHHLTRWSAGNVVALLQRKGFEILEVHPEPTTSFRQVQSASRDILWALALGPFAFGLATRAGAAPRPLRRADGTRSWRRTVARAGIRSGAGLKRQIVNGCADLVACAAYLPARYAGWQGKSVLILARLSAQSHTRPVRRGEPRVPRVRQAADAAR